MSTSPLRSAAEAYADCRADVAALLKILQTELDRHDEGAKREPESWPLVDELASVRSTLIARIARLQGLPEVTVEMMLSQYRAVNGDRPM
jgi:hypothetical protein